MGTLIPHKFNDTEKVYSKWSTHIFFNFPYLIVFDVHLLETKADSCKVAFVGRKNVSNRIQIVVLRLVTLCSDVELY